MSAEGAGRVRVVAQAALFLALVLALIGGAFALAWRNYAECRTAGFSRLYCTTTHFVR